MQVTVSDKGQITLPQALRKQLGIEPGSQLQVVAAEDGSFHVQVLKRGSDGLAGLLHQPGRPVMSLEDMDDAIAQTVAERDLRSRSGGA
jgi:AbrB family looped-hinge helix DNA binding protein